MTTEFGSPNQSSLWHLTPSGELIEYKTLAGKLAAESDVRVYSIAPAMSRLFIASGRRVYVSNDEAESFQILLEAQAAVHLEVNPADALELVAVADSLYISNDGGVSWIASSLPGRKLGRPAASWDDGMLAVPVLDQLGGAVHIRNLDYQD